MNHTSFPPPYGTWYSRWAAIYTEVPAIGAVVADVTPFRTLPTLTEAA